MVLLGDLEKTNDTEWGDPYFVQTKPKTNQVCFISKLRNINWLTTLNQTLMLGIPSCQRVFRGRAHSSAYLPLLEFARNVSLMNPSLDPACDGGGSHLG